MNLPSEFTIEYTLGVEILAAIAALADFSPNNLTREQAEAKYDQYNKWWLSVMENTPEGYTGCAVNSRSNNPRVAPCVVTGEITLCRTVTVRYWKAKVEPSNDTTPLDGKLILVRDSDNEEWKIRTLRRIDHEGAWTTGLAISSDIVDSRWKQYRFIVPSELANEDNT